MKCCLCGNQILVENSGWAQGNNAQPVKDGRCCDECNIRVVIPFRLTKSSIKSQEDKK